MTRRFISAAAAIGAALPAIAQACATCGCSLSSDAATGYSSGPGWRVDLQYSYIDQGELRYGTHSVSTPEVAALNDRGGNQEVERDTTNRYLTLGVAYSPSVEWNVAVQVPYVSRSHSTYGAATTDQIGPSNLSGSSFDALGDVRLIASYQGFLPTDNLGVQLGVKLPTGRFGGQNVLTGAQVGRSPVYFSSGPNAANNQTVDSSLQPGTGSTDLILGAYYYQPVSQDFDAFINGRFQVAALEMLDQVNANYRPGNQLTISAGLRYEADPVWTPQLQINYTHKAPDQGVLADIQDTAGDVVYVSPGLTVRLDTGLQVYGFVQVPLYSDLIGYQLFPRWTANAGVSYSF